MPSQKSTKVGGKEYATRGLPDGTVAGINKAEMLGDEFFSGTSGAPDEQETTPFGTTTP